MIVPRIRRQLGRHDDWPTIIDQPIRQDLYIIIRHCQIHGTQTLNMLKVEFLIKKCIESVRNIDFRNEIEIKIIMVVIYVF